MMLRRLWLRIPTAPVLGAMVFAVGLVHLTVYTGRFARLVCGVYPDDAVRRMPEPLAIRVFLKATGRAS